MENNNTNSTNIDHQSSAKNENNSAVGSDNYDECNLSQSSSDSYQSLNNKIDSLNIENSEFVRPETMAFKEECYGATSLAGDEVKHDSDTDKTEYNKENTKIDKYFIDEEFLIELESKMSEDEKIERHKQALDFKSKGNVKFKEGSYEEASILYTQSLNLCPFVYAKDRAVLYANRAAARSKSYMETEKKGAIEDCGKAIELDPSYLKAILRRANLYQQMDNLEEALKDFERILEIDPYNEEARRAKMFLPQQIQEKNEKLKEEMMGKLKDLGNLILKPFGLSTNNFQLNKNEETGGYNINFKQNS